MEHDAHDHAHGGGFELEPVPRLILQNGLRQLLRLTADLEFKPIVSARYPLPLTQAVCGDIPAPREVRDRVASRVGADPVGALDDALVLLELFEANQDGRRPARGRGSGGGRWTRNLQICLATVI